MHRFRTALIGLAAASATVALVAAPDAAPPAAILTASVVGHRVVIARGDGGVRRFRTGWGAQVSPDGSQVVVTDYDLVGRSIPQRITNNRLKLFAAAGGPARRVIRIRCGPFWSPDSTKLACVELNDSHESVRLLLIDAASGATTTLVRGVVDTAASFSPDSTKIAFVRRTRPSALEGKLQTIDLTTRAVTTIRTGALADPVWGPSLIALAVEKPRPRNAPIFNVAVLRPDGGGFRRLTNFRPNFLQIGLSPVAWSADGKRLLGGLGGQDTSLAYAIDPIRGGARKISTRMTPSAISKDGNFVIGDTTAGEDFGPTGSNVVRAPWVPGSAGVRVLLRNAKDPSYSG